MYYDNSYGNQNDGYDRNAKENQKINQAGKNTPPVRVELTESEFSLLNEAYSYALHYGNPDEQAKAKKLQDKIMKYTREFTDDQGNKKKRICFFESEAAATISILLREKSGGNPF